MTTFFKKQSKCNLCGTPNTFSCISSTNAFGSADLDSRPPEMRRSTISTWVQRCCQCGYCSHDIAETLQGSSSLIQDQKYRYQLHDSAYPDLANSFLCLAVVHEANGQRLMAGLANMHAAWVCDDYGQNPQACKCRIQSADLLRQNSKTEGMTPVAKAILVDLMRRSGRFDDAREAIESRTNTYVDRSFKLIFRFQNLLIERNDEKRYTLEDAGV